MLVRTGTYVLRKSCEDVGLNPVVYIYGRRVGFVMQTIYSLSGFTTKSFSGIFVSKLLSSPADRTQQVPLKFGEEYMRF
jgi:hypothetical protein